MLLGNSGKLTPVPLNQNGFNPNAQLPYGLTTSALKMALQAYLDFLTAINASLIQRGSPRLEQLLMPANFSSIVGELVKANIPLYCPSLVVNKYHNGHPDLLPAGSHQATARSMLARA